MASSTICRCGCGQQIPQKASNGWINGRPCWGYMCINTGCSWALAEYLNQSGDPKCSACGRPRVLLGHYLRRKAGGYDELANGKRRLRVSMDSSMWDPHGTFLEAEGGKRWT